MSRARKLLPLLPATVLSALLSLAAAAIVLAGESGYPIPK
jgi:hypothetical protein